MHRIRISHSSVKRWAWLGALWLVAACGEREGVAPLDPAGAPPAPSGSRPPQGTGGALGDVPEPAVQASAEPPRADLLANSVAELLGVHCASCHTSDAAFGFSGDPRDIPGMIAQGVIVPGEGARSPLVLSMRDGSMPPRTAGAPGAQSVPTQGEIALVSRYIDSLPVAPPAGCEALPFQGVDAVYQALRADVLQAPAEVRPFLRYIGLNHVSNAGLCGAALERERLALFELVNRVSSTPEVHLPQAVGEQGLLYRIDIRDYGWARNIELESDAVELADGWLAIVAAAGVYGSELEGPDADVLKQETGAAVPFLPANALIHAASAGELYYALIGAGATADETQLALGVDPWADVAGSGVKRAGAYYTRPSGAHELRVMRFEQRALPGRYYWLAVDEDTYDAESIFEDPLGIDSGPWQVIYQLPNGMQAYETADALLAHTAARPHDCRREDCRRPEGLSVATCPACHDEGLLPITDSVRSFVEQNATLFDSETFAGVLSTYPIQSELDQLLLGDSQAHVGAVARAGVVREGPEPVSFVYLGFELDALPLPRVAAELGVTPAALTAALGELDSRLDVLQAPEGTIDRATLDAVYVTSLCALHAEARNRPTACR